MKLSGHVKIEKVDIITNNVVEVIEKDNIITDIAYQDNRLTGDCWWEANNIFISNETATPTRSKTSIQCMGTATRGTGQPPITAYIQANPPYFVITQRFDAVTTARTFQTVGLTKSNPGQVTNTTVEPYAYLLLNQPCTQEINQILNVIYRITVEVPVDAPNLSKPFYFRFYNEVVKSMAAAPDFGPTRGRSAIWNTVANIPLKEYGWRSLFISRNLPSATRNTAGLTRIDTTNQRTLFFRSKQNQYIERDNSFSSQTNGRVYNGILYGRNDNYYAPGTVTGQGAIADGDPGLTYSAYGAYTALSDNQTKFLQSAFAYSNNPPDNYGPMFLPDNNSSGTGVLQFSEDPWTGIWPTIYRIRITEAGNVGTAKFVLGVKHFTSYNADGNYTYSRSTRAFHPYVASAVQPYSKCHGWQATMPILAWDNLWTVQADNDGLSLINQFTGQHFDFDATTTPALPITSFRQFALDQANNYIYVACANTGLWRLNIANKAATVITNISTTPTYAVDIDSAGNVYCFMNLATTALTLTSSISNYTSNLGFTTVSLTTANRIYIYVNKIHPDTRIAIALRNGNNQDANNPMSSAFIYWWSLAAGNAGSYTTNIQFCGESQCSFAWVKNNNSKLWTGVGNLLTFGSSTSLNGSNRLFDPPNYNNSFFTAPDIDISNSTFLSGVRNIQRCNANVVQDYWGFLVAPNNVDNIYSPVNGSAIGSYNQLRLTRPVGLPNGIILSEEANYSIFTNGMNNDDLKWIWYKWNGTNWVQAVDYNTTTGTVTNSTGTETRTTSSSFIPLLDGINVRFTNGATGTSFITNEVYDQYVCKGFLKTNDTDLYLESNYFYTQPVFERVTLTPTIISATNNHGVVVDGAPGNLGLSAAVSAITVNPLWYSILPEYWPNTMAFTINNIPVTTCYSETINTLPAQNTLTTGQIIVYRNGLILCSTQDANKTLRGYFSYVARSN